VYFIALALTLLRLTANGVPPPFDPPLVPDESQVAEFDLTDPARPHSFVLQGSSYPKPFRDIDNAVRRKVWGEDAGAR